MSRKAAAEPPTEGGAVVDSSIVLAWVMPDETAPGAAEAQEIMALGGAVAASHWPLEVANALLMAVRRRRIDLAYCEATLLDLAALPISLDTETSAQAWQDTFRLAVRHQLTLYDAACLELAQRRRLPLATLDGALRQAASRMGIRVLAA